MFDTRVIHVCTYMFDTRVMRRVSHITHICPEMTREHICSILETTSFETFDTRVSCVMCDTRRVGYQKICHLTRDDIGYIEMCDTRTCIKYVYVPDVVSCIKTSLCVSNISMYTRCLIHVSPVSHISMYPMSSRVR